MTINDIQKLIANDEHRMLELKKSTGELKDGMHTACAFLNTDGGWLIFGVAPTSLKITGQDVTDATQREIAQALAGLEPIVDVRVEYIPVHEPDGPKVIAIHFDAYVWGKTPYTFQGCPYYKVESTTMRMPRDMFSARLIACNIKQHSWERQPAEGITLDDINQDRVKNSVRMGVDAGRIITSASYDNVYDILEKWHLLTKEGQPNNAAALLFGTNTREYPQFKLQMARFVGNSKNEFLDSLTVEGNFFDLLDAGTSFFFKHLFQSGRVVGFIREEHLEIPAEALREALTNALCHRQWEKANQAICIAIFDDRLEISNPGCLPQELPLEQLKQPHSSYPYNPIIAEVLFQIKMLEKRGTGVNRIIEACHVNNVPEPEWTNEHGLVTVTFKRIKDFKTQQSVNDNVSNDVSEKSNDVDKKSNEVSDNVKNENDNVNDNVSDNVKNENDNVNDNVSDEVELQQAENSKAEDILTFCTRPRSRREILEHIGLKLHTDNFNKYIKPLIDSGQLQRTQPDTPKSPTQKYVVKSDKKQKIH
jgi:ATP-dependent DNA helicase RecG